MDKYSKGRNKPISPRGAIYNLSDNAHIDRTKVVKGVAEPRKCIIKARNTKGEVSIYRFLDRKSAKWDNSKWVSDLNKWRSQIFRRVFKRDPNFVKNPTRAKWSEEEVTYLSDLIKKRAGKTQSRLTKSDWEKISKKHNERWNGVTVPKGAKLMKGDLARGDQLVGERTTTAIQALFERIPGLKSAVNDLTKDEISSDSEMDLIDKVDSEDPDDADESGSESHGGSVKHNLEDSSDDEVDGQRPAANPTGGVLIAA
ncbi:hypothetical protein G7Y89_g7692 [Cudoniella acicularis]|uniref:Uncharacterized protein n=1 Tax=Cudoniella acicularis TaxID=354080 RepID=A0A8H4W1T6_9HELO|nr:hypothetical protein G7Y89_g7692 [Cudoniella acicularis]